MAASEKFKEDNLLNFVLSTAHPVKFSKSVEGYIGKKLNLLDDYKNLFSLKESFIALENDEMKLKELINSKN